MLRVRVVGTGYEGGPSLNTLYFLAATEDVAGAQACINRVQAGFVALFKGHITPVVTWNIVPDVDIIDPETGNVTATRTGVSPAGSVGVGSTVRMPPAVACLVRLQTATFLSGRRVRGRWFISPTTTTSVASDGSTAGTLASNCSTAAVTFQLGALSEPTLVVWHRPKLGVGGSTAVVTGISAGPKMAVLRSRRD